MQNFRQIAVAIRSYNDTYGRLPPAAALSKDRKPLYSWRVAILPFMGPDDDDLYKEFQKDKPWDSPHNQELLSRMPKVFELAGHQAPQAGETFIQVFTGPQAPFDDTKSPSILFPFRGFTDGLSNTLLLAEAADAVPWTKPADLQYAANNPVPKLGNHYGMGTLVATADRGVRFLNPKISDETLRAAITPDGGEELGTDW